MGKFSWLVSKARNPIGSSPPKIPQTALQNLTLVEMGIMVAVLCRNVRLVNSSGDKHAHTREISKSWQS